MASPPSSVPIISLPRKRPSIQTSSLPAPKRRKPSSARVPSHLRQTSFPPEDEESLPPNSALSPPASAPRSRELSVDSALNGPGGTPSILSGRSGGKRRRAGAVLVDDGRSDPGSTRKGDTGGAGGEDGGDEEIDDDELREAQANITGDQADETEMKRSKENMRVLYENLTEAEKDRYAVWKVAMPRKDALKRLVNQTLSQSVPATVITAVMASTRVFIGELVDTACEVRKEWQAASKTLPTGEEVPDNESIRHRTTDENQGPLTPDQLREALRRVKKERDGGTPGLMGLSMTGLDNTAPKMNGRRLFR